LDGSQRCRAAQDLYADLMRLALAWGEQAGREGAEPAKARRDGNGSSRKEKQARPGALPERLLP